MLPLLLAIVALAPAGVVPVKKPFTCDGPWVPPTDYDANGNPVRLEFSVAVMPQATDFQAVEQAAREQLVQRLCRVGEPAVCTRLLDKVKVWLRAEEGNKRCAMAVVGATDLEAWRAQLAPSLDDDVQAALAPLVAPAANGAGIVFGDFDDRGAAGGLRAEWVKGHLRGPLRELGVTIKTPPKGFVGPLPPAGTALTLGAVITDGVDTKKQLPILEVTLSATDKTGKKRTSKTLAIPAEIAPRAPTATVAKALPWPRVVEGKPSGGGENDVAVIAGVSDYYQLPDIAGARDNATDWYLYLTKTRKVPASRVRVLRDAEVSKEGLEQALQEAAAQAKPGGLAWFVFIGHGAPTDAGDDGALVGADALPNARSLAARSLPQKTALAALHGKQDRTIAIFDSCFSGSSPDGRTPLDPGRQATLPVRRVPPPATDLVFSSSERFAGPLPKHDRPAFSYLLLGALHGWGDSNGDKRVTAQEAYDYARDVLTTVVKDRDQVPSLAATKSDVVLSTGAAEKGPDLIEIVANGL